MPPNPTPAHVEMQVRRHTTAMAALRPFLQNVHRGLLVRVHTCITLCCETGFWADVVGAVPIQIAILDDVAGCQCSFLQPTASSNKLQSGELITALLDVGSHIL
jgi:hypothetical protein